MAEYIDKQGLIKFLDNIQQPKMPITEGFKYITIDDAMMELAQTGIETDFVYGDEDKYKLVVTDIEEGEE